VTSDWRAWSVGPCREVTYQGWGLEQRHKVHERMAELAKAGIVCEICTPLIQHILIPRFCFDALPCDMASIIHRTLSQVDAGQSAREAPRNG